MGKRVEFEGKVHEFPDDFGDVDIAKALQSYGQPQSYPGAQRVPAQPMHEQADADKSGGFLGMLGHDLQYGPTEMLHNLSSTNPLDLVRGATDARLALRPAAKAQWEQGNPLLSAGMYASSIIPFLGPVIGNALDELGSSDPGRGQAHLLEMVAPFALDFLGPRAASAVATGTRTLRKLAGNEKIQQKTFDAWVPHGKEFRDWGSAIKSALAEGKPEFGLKPNLPSPIEPLPPQAPQVLNTRDLAPSNFQAPIASPPLPPGPPRRGLPPSEYSSQPDVKAAPPSVPSIIQPFPVKPTASPTIQPIQTPFQLKPGEGTHLNFQDLEPGKVPTKADYAARARSSWANIMNSAFQSEGKNIAHLANMSETDLNTMAKRYGLNESSPEKVKLLIQRLSGK